MEAERSKGNRRGNESGRKEGEEKPIMKEEGERRQ